MGYYEQLYGSYQTFLIRIDGKFDGKNNYSACKRPEKERHPVHSDAAFGVVEAARRLGCSPSYLRQLVHQDLIGHKWFGRMLKFRQQDIEDYWKSDHGRSRRSTGGGETPQRGPRTKKPTNTKGDKNTGVSRADLKGRLSTWD